MGTNVRVLIAVVLVASPLVVPGAVSGQTEGEVFGHPRFVEVWDRTDLPVEQVQAQRTWIWGPGANTQIFEEPYEEGLDGLRWVQYSDKSRMELPIGDVPADSEWFITQGLLATELMTGNLQLGDTSFEQYEPSHAYVAGDPVDNQSPTYAQMGQLIDRPARPTGGVITEVLTSTGEIAEDFHTDVYAVTDAYYIEQTDKHIASVFWSFMNSSGIVYEDGQYVEGALFENPFYAIGFPITEAYWGIVTVAGTPQNVLIQCFERRCFTYAPDNPDGWEVESGNIGQHYYDWRYHELGDPIDDSNGDPSDSGNGDPGNGDPPDTGNGDPGNGDPPDPGNGEPGNGDPPDTGNGTPEQGECVAPGQSIQSALDAAAPGNEVCVEPGTYNEVLEMSTSNVALVGEPGVVLDGSGLGGPGSIGIEVLAGDTIVTGLAIRNVSGTGIALNSASNVSLFNLEFGSGIENGIAATNSHNLEVANVVMTFDPAHPEDSGITLQASSQFLIDNVEILGSMRGVMVQRSSEFPNEPSGTIRNSLISSNHTAVTIGGGEEITVENNQLGAGIRVIDVFANPVEELFIQNNFIAGDGEVNGIRLSQPTDATIYRNTIDNVDTAINLFGGVNAKVYENSIMQSETGVRMSFDGSSASIDGNEFRDNRFAVDFHASANVFITNNLITNHETGIRFVETSEATIHNNWIETNGFGIFTLQNANGSLVSANNNDILNNRPGIEVSWAPDGHQMNARFNYWGASDGPTGGGGSGDAIFGPVNVDYIETSPVNPELEP